MHGNPSTSVAPGVANSGRAMLALITLGLGYALVGGVAFSLFAPTAPAWFRTAAGLSRGALAAIAVWRASANASGLGGAMVTGAGLLGGIGFGGGFFGPMLLAPSANQGPLLGMFMTGPGGFVLGAVAGVVRWAMARRTP
ncbi:MAG: hypothetical protein H7268_00690 [Sandarakinorhabdus sp.]|nr:hypothetical protein [Sandarakinorhabdus sp.]